MSGCQVPESITTTLHHDFENMIFSWISRQWFLFSVSSGSVTINEDSSVQILAEEAARLDELDREVSFRNMVKQGYCFK